ncbi:MAG: glycoside hydrolase family 127 protein [Bacteroidia bacterium]|nr:glycoside hydrolase family 127 protein [Bacteroidia bacterium]
MKNYSALILLFVFLSFSLMASAQQSNNPSNYLNNRSPLISKPFIELPLGAISPEGWLKDQLLRQKSGMTGHLDEIYEKVMGNRNGWLGGDGDVWERGPYWIDGLLPLAYILKDDALIAKVKPWVEWALNSQQANGYFGPSVDHANEPGLQRSNARDWWPKMVVLKFLQQYYSATQDERVIRLMLNYFKYQLKELPKTPLNHWTHWGEDRGGDNLAVVYWLYNLTGEKFLLELGELIHKQTVNWTDAFLTGQLRNQWSFHCVNVAQGMKEPGVYYQQTKDKKYVEAVKAGLADLKAFHGFPDGLYGADEMLHGNNPTQGSEFCSAVEMMFSMESILPVTGEVAFADQLERVAFNALPTQATDNYDSRQYFQQTNQVMVSHHPRNFNTAYEGTGQLFGPLTGYPCCTSNMHQGWPKFTQNLWYASADNGIAALVYAPSKVKAKVGKGTNVEITESTNYPFDESIRFRIKIEKRTSFSFHLRIPAWCKKSAIRINGQLWGEPDGNNLATITREWSDGDAVVLSLPMQVTVSRWYENSAVVERGPLVYALKIGEEWKKVVNTDKYGPFYYEVLPSTPWNFGLLTAAIANPGKEFEVVKRAVSPGSYPWNQENAPIEIKTKGVVIPFWTLYNGSAGPLPYSEQDQLKTDPPVEITLIPYGCTTLRITEFPVARIKE